MIDPLLEQFLIEGRELVQQASDDLLTLEHDPENTARIDSVFRAAHTLKGSVALFDFKPMGEAIHAAEDLLGAIREGRQKADNAAIDALLDCIGVCEDWIEAIARSGGLPDSASAQSRRLVGMLHGMTIDGTRAPPLSATLEPDWLAGLLVREAEAVAEARHAGKAITALRYVPSADCFFLGDDPLALMRSMPDLLSLDVRSREPWTLGSFSPFQCNLVIEALTAAAISDVQQLCRFVADQIVIVEASHASAEVATILDPTPDRSSDAVSQTIRVDASRIDALVDIVGELIVAKNGLGHLAEQASRLDPHWARSLNAQYLDIERLIGNMHTATMGIRMLPLSRTFRRFPRLVRDIAMKLGKDINLTLSGDDVEVDKAIAEGVFEPLLHILRNAVDHGIEPPEQRLAHGKPALGTVSLAARRDGDQIVIAVSDDGAGLDPDKIRGTARRNSLLGDAALAALDDAAVLELIFMPGFSTNQAVTDISGRGVGMDVVLTTIKSFGGRVELDSTVGAGSTIRLILPQTVAVTRVLTVTVEGERFGIPIDVVTETALVRADRIIPIRNGEAFVLRDQTIPLVRLAALLDLPDAEQVTVRQHAADARVLIVLSGDQRVGVEVDRIASRADVLLRPMTGLLSGMAGFLGAALMGDGKVLMVLDLPELIG